MKHDKTLERLADASLRVLAAELEPAAVDAWIQEINAAPDDATRAELLRNLIGSELPAALAAFESALAADDPKLRAIGVRGLVASAAHRERLLAFTKDASPEVRDELTAHGIEGPMSAPWSWVCSKLATMKHGLRRAKHEALRAFVEPDRGAVATLIADFLANQRLERMAGHYGRATLGGSSARGCLVRYIVDQKPEVAGETWPAERVAPKNWSVQSSTPNEPTFLRFELEHNEQLFPATDAVAFLVCKIDHDEIAQSDTQATLVGGSWSFEFEIDPKAAALGASDFEVWLLPPTTDDFARA